MEKKRYEKLYEAFCGREYDVRERIFRTIVLVGGTLGILGVLECMVLMDIQMIQIPLVMLLFALGLAFLATFKYRKIDLAAMLVGFLIILIIFPAMFLLSGGLEGGGSLWFALGLFYVFLMFSGRRLAFFLTLSLLTDIATYGYCYFFPEVIMPMASPAAAYLDSLFAVIAVGLAGGAILKFQMKIFDIERSVAQKQQEELTRVSNSKNNFFASMSHEIRTPINAIIGLNEMILRESKEITTKEYAQNIQSASRMLLNLVNDVLDLSQMEMKKMEVVPVEYRTADLFGDLIDMIDVRLKEKNLEFKVDIDENLPSVLWGDKKRISQVILNLLTNAAKYTNKGSVTLFAHAEYAADGSMQLKVSITDTGIGIRKEDLQYIYDSFMRMDARNNLKIEGSGLGLSITKHLVDLMDGEISVDSIYTKGSVFTVILPQAVVDPAPIGTIKFLSRSRRALEEYRQSFEAPEARILIVDDNHMNSMVAGSLLKATKVSIDSADSGERCLQMTKLKYYHVILMDYRMPELNGYQTLKQLRKQENGLCRDSAVIVLSASSATETGASLLEEGFDGYLEKPVRGNALEAEILKFLPDDLVEYRLDRDKAENETEIQKISRKKRKKIYITTDCVSDLPESLIEKYDIGMIYLYIQTERGRFTDTLEISSDNMLRHMADAAGAAHADTVSVEEYEAFFADMLTKAEQVIHISMARNMGKSYDTAVTAAEGFDHVRVIDSGHISCGQGLVALYAGRLAMEGCRADEIIAAVENMKKTVEAHYIMPSAATFCRHGMTGKLNAALLDFFGLHPVLKMSQSRLVITGARIGKLEDAWKGFIRRHFLRKGKISSDILFISHVGCNVEQQELIRREALRRIPFQKVILQKASVTTACNAGTGTFGFAYYKPEK